MSLVSTPAIVLSAIRYSETSKIVRLATREFGVQSAIAKGALRPKSRFGAALQLLSDGTAHLIVRDHRELHTLTAFDVGRVRVGLTGDLERYSTAAALAEVMLRFAPPDPQPDSYDLLLHALDELEGVAADIVVPLSLRLVWALVRVLGFAPSLDACVRDGLPLDEDGPVAFSTHEGGALCRTCAAAHGTTRLPADARAALHSLMDPAAPLPVLDEPNAAAHRRLAARFVRFHLGEGTDLPALEFWERRPWRAA